MKNNTQQTFLQKTKRFFEPAKDNIKDTYKILVYFAIEGAFGILFIFFIQDVTRSFELLDRNLFQESLFNYGMYFIVLFIFLGLLHTWWALTYNRFKKSIESEYLPKYICFDMNTQEKIGTGKSIAIISKGVKMWAGLLDRLLMEAINVVLSVGLTIYLLFQINHILVLLLLMLLVVTLSIGLILNSYIIIHRRKRIELGNLWTKTMVKIIMAKNEILQSKKISNEIERLAEFHEGQIYYNKKMSPYLVSFFALGPIIVIILLYVIFIYFGKLYFEGSISLSIIIGLSGAIVMMQKVFMNLLDFLKNFTKEFAEIQNMWDFFDNTPQIQGYEEGNTFQHKTGTISLKNVSYGYDENKPVFQDFDLDIAGNKVTALVGPSGGGKSTLVKLIAGYIRADSGELLIDDQRLSETSLKSYYQDIGYLTQEPSVFDGSVRENLMYGVTEPHLNSSPQGEDEATKDMQPLSPQGERIQDRGFFNDRLKKIITLANCEFIYDLPNGLDTEIGERGVKLSGGQKQRLAIAKIFLKDPKIIILDEPTSALDSLSEKKITQAMHNLFKNRTVLVIAHRLQTVKHADDIIVIDGGQVRERGTHAQLVKRKGFYKEMLDLQSGF